MHDDSPSEAPTTEEVMQRDGDETVPFPTLPVAVEGPVRVQVLPRRGIQTFRTQTVPPGPYRILDQSPTRAKATIIATTDDFWIGRDRAAVDSSQSTPSAAVLWPPSLPFETESTQGLWINSTNPTGQSISVVTESWED